MPAGLCVPQGLPGFLLQPLVRHRQGLQQGEPGRLLPAPYQRRDQPPEREPSEFSPFVAVGSMVSEEAGETPSVSQRAD